MLIPFLQRLLLQCKNILKPVLEDHLETLSSCAVMMIKVLIYTNSILLVLIMVIFLLFSKTLIEWKAVAVGENYKNAKEFL